MIVFDQVSRLTKDAVGRGRPILSSVDLVIPANRRIALLGEPFEHTRTIVDLVAGVIAPSSGRVIRKAHVSFPAGETRAFIPEISVRGNVQHIARLYAADHLAVARFAEEVMDIGAEFDKPYGSLARDLRRILSHIVAYSIPFEVYVLTETIRHGRGGLNDVARELLKARMETAGLIAPTRDMGFAEEFCDSAILLRDAKLYAFDKIDDAVKAAKLADSTLANAGRP
jgi:capsular polysaccharide transport system ATP-binding protein